MDDVPARRGHARAAESGNSERNVLGATLAAAAAFAYAITIVIGRVLAREDIPSSLGLGLRFSIAGIALLAGTLITRRPLVPARGERVAAALLGLVGYAVESTFFYLGLAHGTAAAVALLFYAYPVMVALAEMALGRRRPRPLTVLALILSASGAAAVAAGGGRVEISGVGIAYSLASAASFAAYLLTSERVMRRTDPVTTATWVALGAAVALLSRAALTTGIRVPPGHVAQLLGYGGATAIAFACMFGALRLLGPAPTAVVMTLEAAFAVVLAAVVLGEPLRVVEIAGGTCILVGAAIIGLSRATSLGATSHEEPPTTAHP